MEAEVVKTSLRLPRSLWQEAHRRALDGKPHTAEPTTFGEVVIEALREYLQRHEKGRKA